MRGLGRIRISQLALLLAESLDSNILEGANCSLNSQKAFLREASREVGEF